MKIKSPTIERQIIISNDHRRKYGARIDFEVLSSGDIADLENVSLLLPSGRIMTIKSSDMAPWEKGKCYAGVLEGFTTATAAEEAGIIMYQALLSCAINLNFGIKFHYSSQEPSAVFDRTQSCGFKVVAYGSRSFSQPLFLEKLFSALSSQKIDRQMILSMELFSAAQLETSLRTKFVMTVSALEPLAKQESVSTEISDIIKKLTDLLNSFTIPQNIKDSLRSRINELNRESVGLALRRLCEIWFPNEPIARNDITEIYKLRSQLLHEGQLNDKDILLHDETIKISNYLQRIYNNEISKNTINNSLI